MAIKDTKTIMDEYFNTYSNRNTVERVRGQIDRSEVYLYEAKKNKQIFEMDREELFEMISTFNKKFGGLSYSSYDQVRSLFKYLFEYYSDNYELIKNPFAKKDMATVKYMEYISNGKEPMTYEMLQDIIHKVHETYIPYKADYIECIMLLFYNGVSTPREIVEITDTMINHRNKTLYLPNRTVHLSDRCYQLLREVHDMDEIEGRTYSYIMVPYHEGYFKFPIRGSQQKTFDARPMNRVTNIITLKLITDVSRALNVDVSYRSLYMLGFMDYLREKYGEQKANDIVISSNDVHLNDLLMDAANAYGITTRNAANLKRDLRLYCKV